MEQTLLRVGVVSMLTKALKIMVYARMGSRGLAHLGMQLPCRCEVLHTSCTTWPPSRTSPFGGSTKSTSAQMRRTSSTCRYWATQTLTLPAARSGTLTASNPRTGSYSSPSLITSNQQRSPVKKDPVSATRSGLFPCPYNGNIVQMPIAD